MEGYDPSLSGVLRRKLSRIVHSAWQLLPLWNPSAIPLDPEVVLDAREIAVYRLYGMNRTPREIAIRLFISIQSAETHLTVISRKLRIRRRDLRKFAAEYSHGARVQDNRN